MDLTENQIEQLVKLLSVVTPGYYPIALFWELSRLTVNPIIEIVPLRKRGDITEILLLQRETNDRFWPGQLHTPGAVIRPDDTAGSFTGAFNRILKDELKGLKAGTPQYVTNILHRSDRGMEASQIYWAEVLGEPTVGAFYNADDLPGNVLKSQLDFIPLAVDIFNKYHAAT